MLFSGEYGQNERSHKRLIRMNTKGIFSRLTLFVSAHACAQLQKQVELLNDKCVCANADLRADMERWHKNKRKDFRKLFVEMADRNVKYYEKVSAKFSTSRCSSFQARSGQLLVEPNETTGTQEGGLKPCGW